MSTEICLGCLLLLLLTGAAVARYAWVHWIMSEEEIVEEHRRLRGWSQRSRRW